MSTAATTEMPATAKRGGAAALMVAAGIFLSRVAGLVRTRVFAHYFGASDTADAFNAAFRIPNFLQNLFGEGVLSASFIPVYANLLARGDEREAGRIAGAVASLLVLVASTLVLVGVITTPYLIDAIAPGFEGEKRELTIDIVRVLFPGAGLFVLSAWCLGVLNSHRRFFLSYISPVLWNAAMIATLVAFGGLAQPQLAVTLAWGSVVGAALQVAVQVPTVLRLARGLRFAIDVRSPNVLTVVRNFGPVFVSRGVVQISGYVDAMLASLLPTGAVTDLTNAQVLYLLPVSLFGMAVSAAELPAMSGAVGSEDEIAAELRRRLAAGLGQIAFFIVPSAMAFLAFGDVIAGALFQSGRFTHDDALHVWGTLAGSAVGLLASTLGRLYSSTYYALRDTRTPLRFAIVRVVLTTTLGYLCAIPLPVALGIDPRWGVAGLTASAGVAGWVEFALLRRSLNARIGRTGLTAPFVAKLWASAAVGAALGWGAKLAMGSLHPIALAIAVLGPYGLVYVGATAALGVPEVRSIARRFRR
jgi:putative peptidoglycan lipid II flippase